MGCSAARRRKRGRITGGTPISSSMLSSSLGPSGWRWEAGSPAPLPRPPCCACCAVTAPAGPKVAASGRASPGAAAAGDAGAVSCAPPATYMAPAYHSLGILVMPGHPPSKRGALHGPLPCWRHAAHPASTGKRLGGLVAGAKGARLLHGEAGPPAAMLGAQRLGAEPRRVMTIAAAAAVQAAVPRIPAAAAAGSAGAADACSGAVANAS